MDYQKIAKNVLAIEAQALIDASERFDKEQISKIVDIYAFLQNVGGNLIFCGVGKSGYIAQKLASTFSSLGLPSFFLHPVEALHGDLGRVNKSDAIVFISKSGTTEEILKLMPYLPVEKSMKIGFVGNLNSPIAQRCGIVFDCSVVQEACINNQAPTTSSTLSLAIGDALAVVFESSIGLSKEGFAINHPGGLLGKALRIKVKDLMWTTKDCSVLTIDSNLQDVILGMTKRNIGGCAIIDAQEKFLGIIVEGDIRRTFTKENGSLETAVADIMNPNPVTTTPDALAFDVLKLMEQRRRQIDILPVISEDNRFLGFIRLHDLLREGFTQSS